MQYTVLIEHTPGNNYGASVPDLPGCIATGATREEVERLIREAIEFHLEGMRQDGEPIPQPTTAAIVVDIAA
jgi:predicted RNase H-like HicB family nuclease